MASSLSPPAAAPAPNQGTTDKNQTGRHNHHPLQCPRCNSSNTKFCYYNNYSLSQPRHFCKACKRYWTRGGTLRNVPVGGGCRKNKRLNRPPPQPSAGGAGVSSASTTTATATAKPNIDMSPASNHTNNSNPPFYTLNHHYNNNTQLELNFPFSGFGSTGPRDNSNNNTESGYDFQPQIINGLGLGFSSGLMANDHSSSTGNSSIFFSSSSSSTMASFLNSSLQQQRFGTNCNDISFKDMIINGGRPVLTPYDEETQMLSDQNGSVIMGKDVKLEGENGLRPDWNPDRNPNPFERMMNSSNDVSSSSSMIWSTTNLGAWFDPSNSNMDSSVPSL